jgi:hypothetical protein
MTKIVIRGEGGRGMGSSLGSDTYLVYNLLK